METYPKYEKKSRNWLAVPMQSLGKAGLYCPDLKLPPPAIAKA